ncbi:MAG: type II toxin-antitoxin system RelE/ParE family toxin [Anaerolineae bacterium]
MYEAYLERAAERDLRRLPVETFPRIVPRIRALAENPRRPGCRKLTGSENDWRIRIGDCRAIYETDEAEKAVRVYRIRHRREAYR